MALLEMKDLYAYYGHVQALDGISIEVQEGAIVALLGANGAGKSTTLRAISGLIKRRGSIVFDGKPIDKMSPEEIVRLGIAHVPEGRSLFPTLSLWDNLRVGAYVRKDKKAIEEDFKKSVEYFPWMAERKNQPAATLSGGEQQMVAIARGLMLRPRLLLLDEPSLGLAPILVDEIFKVLTKINRSQGSTVLVVEQNATSALDAAHYAYVLEAGRIAVSGGSTELRDDESVRRSYLGY